MGDGGNKYPNEEEQSDGVRARTPKKGKGREGEFLHGRFKRVEICLAVSFPFGSPRCFFPIIILSIVVPT